MEKIFSIAEIMWIRKYVSEKFDTKNLEIDSFGNQYRFHAKYNEIEIGSYTENLGKEVKVLLEEINIEFNKFNVQFFATLHEFGHFIDFSVNYNYNVEKFLEYKSTTKCPNEYKNNKLEKFANYFAIKHFKKVLDYIEDHINS